jgi:hypothetical protein
MPKSRFTGLFRGYTLKIYQYKDRRKPPGCEESMIYTVECTFTNPAIESAWNDFYTLEKLPALISVNGFNTSQRFKALSDGCPAYLAIHSIDNLDILQGDEYRQKGGGNFALWQEYITDWHRNLYDGLNRAPAIGQNEHLVVSGIGPEPLIKMGLTPYQIYAVALERFPEHRWLAKRTHSTDLNVELLPKGVFLYTPMAVQLTSNRGATQQASGQS